MGVSADKRICAILLAYDGTAYHGWQRQPGAPTVQGLLADALADLLGEAVRVVGAGRTDAGVHALGQIASFVTRSRLPAPAIQAALNARLPRDIRVLAAREVPAPFDARRSARSKRYAYLIWTAQVASPFLAAYTWHLPRSLDVAAMAVGLRRLRGKHDFSAFRAAAGRDRSPICTLFSGRLRVRGPLVAIFLSADAFLHHMARNLVGSLAEVGQGKHPPQWMAELLAGRDRRLAGPTAPAQGLFLLSVRYPFPLFLTRRGQRPPPRR